MKIGDLVIREQTNRRHDVALKRFHYRIEIVIDNAPLLGL